MLLQARCNLLNNRGGEDVFEIFLFMKITHKPQWTYIDYEAC